MNEQWIVVKPGGPGGPFWGVVSSSGRVIAMQIPEEGTARQIVQSHAEITALRQQLALTELINVEQLVELIDVLKGQIALFQSDNAALRQQLARAKERADYWATGYTILRGESDQDRNALVAEITALRQQLDAAQRWQPLEDGIYQLSNNALAKVAHGGHYLGIEHRSTGVALSLGDNFRFCRLVNPPADESAS